MVNFGYSVGSHFLPVFQYLNHSGPPITAILTSHYISKNLASLKENDENWDVGDSYAYGGWNSSWIGKAYTEVIYFSSSTAHLKFEVF